MADRKVYLDYNATTPLAPEVLESINVALRDFWGNPSSSHNAGVKARNCIDTARTSVAQMINTDPSDIVFTSGGTESNNMLFHSIINLGGLAGTPPPPPSLLPHVVISNLEHDSINLTAENLKKLGLLDLTVVNADPRTGKVSPEDVLSALQPSTCLVSIMLANNETGIIQPVQKIVEAVREWDRGRAKDVKKKKVFVHTDAAQALGKIPVDAIELGVDYLTIVGHKLYGPRIGALFVKGLDSKSSPLVPMLSGGGQERGYRSGTENTGMIAGLGKAAELITNHVILYGDHMRSVRNYLESKLEDDFGARIHFNGRYESSERIPNTSNISIIGKPFRGNHVLRCLRRCQASVGAACHSHHSSRASPVLVACGVPEDIALNALRISIGRETTHTDIDVFVRDIKNAINTLDA